MTLARFPDVAPDRGHYESFYLRAADPDRPRAVWLRHTVHKRPHEPAVGSVWLTVFDEDHGDPPAAFKASVANPQPGPGGHGVIIGPSTFTPTAVRGTTAGGEARWALDFHDGAEPLPHLPSAWMYTAPIPRTKSGSPHPAARISGTVGLHGRALELDGWPGMVGHNWGAEHAERWIWLHGIGFADAPDAWLDLVCGRIKVGGRTTPWVANGALHLDGVRHRLAGLGRVRGTRVDEHPTGARFVLPGKRMTVQATVAAPAGQTIVWRYADPEGPEHHAAHCSLSRLELTIGPSGRTLRTDHGAAYELGMRETDHGLPVQPFPDP